MRKIGRTNRKNCERRTAKKDRGPEAEDDESGKNHDYLSAKTVSVASCYLVSGSGGSWHFRFCALSASSGEAAVQISLDNSVGVQRDNTVEK